MTAAFTQGNHRGGKRGTRGIGEQLGEQDNGEAGKRAKSGERRESGEAGRAVAVKRDVEEGRAVRFLLFTVGSRTWSAVLTRKAI